MACTTRPDLGKVGTRRIAAVAAAACSVGHQSSSTSNAEDSGWTLSRGSHRPPSDEAPRRPRDESRGGSTPPSCEVLDSPRPRLVRHDCPRCRHRCRTVSHLSPAPAQPPAAANWRSATENSVVPRVRTRPVFGGMYKNDFCARVAGKLTRGNEGGRWISNPGNMQKRERTGWRSIRSSGVYTRSTRRCTGRARRTTEKTTSWLGFCVPSKHVGSVGTGT